MLIQLDLDQAAALHLAHALGAHRRYCDEHAYMLPPALVELHRLADLAKTGRTQPDTPRVVCETETNAPPFLTRRAFAERTGRSERTVRRWIRAGKLTATAVGIPRTELDRLTKGQPRGTR